MNFLSIFRTCNKMKCIVFEFLGMFCRIYFFALQRNYAKNTTLEPFNLIYSILKVTSIEGCNLQ